MEFVAWIREKLGSDWIPRIYEDQVRPLRTRSVVLPVPERENFPELQQTLLGQEIKVGRRRISCPDVSMARYLAVFARLGCRKVAVPYDITEVPAAADRLEAAWARTIAEFEAASAEESPQVRGRRRALLIRTMRNEIRAIGAGEMMPLFDRSTRQRKC